MSNGRINVVMLSYMITNYGNSNVSLYVLCKHVPTHFILVSNY